CTPYSRRDRFHSLRGPQTCPAAHPIPQEDSMKRIVSLALLALFSANFLVACNTVKGAGQDVQKVGEKMEQKADDTGATEPRGPREGPDGGRGRAVPARFFSAVAGAPARGGAAASETEAVTELKPRVTPWTRAAKGWVARLVASPDEARRNQ